MRTSSRLMGVLLALLGLASCGNAGSTIRQPPPPRPSATVARPVAPPPPPPGPLLPAGSICSLPAVDGPSIMAAAKANVVRIKTDAGSGTGFILATPRRDIILIGTAEHVLREAHHVSVVVAMDSAPALELSGLEIVKVDPKSDLALLQASRVPGMPKGFFLNVDGVKTAQPIAALGYPATPGATGFELTFSKGDVSAATIEIGKQKFMVTDMNVNPGHSGGPVVNACGAVVGVVVAMLKGVERMNLLVPVDAVVELYGKYAMPKLPPQEAIKAQLVAFERAVKWKARNEASAFFTESFVESVVKRVFELTLAKVESKLPQYEAIMEERGITRETPPDKRLAALLSVAAPDEAEALATLYLLNQGIMGPHEALHLYLSTWISDIFGEFQKMEVDEVTNATEASGTARVEITNKRGTMLWELQFSKEAGDYRINGMNCIRNCGP